MDVAVAEEPLRKIFRAKKTMKVSDRRQLESLHTTLSSPCSFPSPPQPSMVNGKHCEAVSMEVDKEIHGTTHTTTHATSSLTATSLTTETSEEPTASELLVSSSQNIHSDVKDLQEEGEGDKDSTLPSLEVEDKIKGDRNSKGDVIVSSPVSSEKTEAVRERQVDGMEMDLVPGTTQDTVPILNPAASLLHSSNTAVESVSSPSLSPSYTAESDQEVRPGFLVLSEDDDVQDESDEEQRECEGGVEKVEVNMKKPEQIVSGAPVDSPSPSSPTPLQIDEEEEGAVLQKKRSLSGDSEDGGEKQGERDLEVVERHNKRPRVDCEELEAHVELKISGSSERQHKLKKVVQQLVEEQLCVLQLTLIDKSLQGLRDRLDKIEKHPSALKSLQAKIGRLSKKVGTAIQARENAKKPPEVLLPPTSTHATATTPAESAILGLRTMGNNTPDPKRNDQSSQTPTPVRNDQGSQTPTPVRNDQGSQTPTPLRNDQGSQTPTPVPTASLLPSPSSTASAGSQPTSQTLMLSTCVTPTPGPSAFPLQSFLIQLPGGGTAILTNPTNSQLIPVCALPAMTSSTVTPTTAFLLQRTTPYTPAAPKPPSASALLSHFAAIPIPTTTTTPTDTPAATTSHMTITTPTCRATTTPWATTVTTPTCRPTPRATTVTPPRATTVTPPRATTVTPPRATTVTTPRATTVTTPRATTVTTPRATTVTTPRATTVTTPRATTVTTPRATTVTTPRATTITTPRATTITTPRATTITTPRATTITTPTRRATTTLCATPNVSHPGATGTVSRPSSGVSVSVCESIRLVSVTNSTSTSSLPRISMPATTGTQPSVRPATSVQQAALVQLAAPVPHVPAKTDSTQASHPAKSEAFIDLTEEEEEDDDVLVTGVLKAPVALKASPSPSTAGQRTTATQQTATSTSVGTQAVRSSLGQMSGVGSPHAVYHRPLQGSPSKSVASATSTSSSTPCPQPSPLPPLPVPPQTISLPLEAASTSPPQQPLLKITRVPSHNDGIVLSWSVTEVDRSCAAVDSYHLYAYHQDHSGPSTHPLLWKKIGEVKALALPMACTLTQFVSGSKYYFAVRARDVFGRFGPFCEPQCTDVLTSPSPKAPI
ncbi:activating transcription factor 7-interacting protein 1-like isoform X4 [Oncorhynchus kisutch]|uniref:activating transcription factor 7-interacting protein 1-like isoform X4 n=1 Tax=Oncorhynchus kisutch TaxID=8019 RepID=UPI0012DD84CD|nr:activating transcription factor 7-interacting protein 1-like isoform X4 [Oncorhynchus kisutch]